MQVNDYGSLVGADIQLHKEWFEEMTSMLGIICLHRAPRKDKTYNGYGELNSFYHDPEAVGCIFEDHPSIKTTRLLGWNSELVDSNPVIHVPYNLKGLQIGSLFIIPNPLNREQGRVFKVIEMSTIAIYPASVSCIIGPLLVNNSEKAEHDYTKSNFNLITGEDEED